MTRRFRHAAIILLGVLAATAFATRPAVADDDDAANTAAAPNRVTIKDGVVTLTLSAADQQNTGIVTAHPTPAPAGRTVRGIGSVLDAAPLSALSDRYLDASAGVHIAEAKLAASRAAFERAKLLHRDQQNVSAADLQAAQASFAVDEAGLAVARSRQSMIARSAQQQWGNVIGAALIDGSPLIAGLLQRRDYIVKVTLPFGVAIAAPPPTVAGRLNNGRSISLHLVSPAPAADPQLRAISYFYTAQAADGLLPNLRLAVSLALDDRQSGVIVAESSVVWLQGKAWIYLRTGPSTFERREIRPDHPAPDGGYIVPDLPLSAQLVVRGAQMLLSEEFRAQAPIED